MPGGMAAIMTAGSGGDDWAAMAGRAAHAGEPGSGPDIRGGPGRFVLACIAGSPETTAGINERIRRLRPGLVPGLDPADWELHAGDMFHNRGGSPLGPMGRTRHMDTMRNIVDIICDSDAVTFGAVALATRKRGKRATEAKTAERAMETLVGHLEQFAERRKGMTLRIVSDNIYEKHRLAMKRALDRRALERSTQSRASRRHVTGIEFADSRSSEIVQAVDGVAYMINRNVGGDARFGGLTRDIERKAGRGGLAFSGGRTAAE